MRLKSTLCWLAAMAFCQVAVAQSHAPGSAGYGANGWSSAASSSISEGQNSRSVYSGAGQTPPIYPNPGTSANPYGSNSYTATSSPYGSTFGGSVGHPGGGEGWGEGYADGGLAPGASPYGDSNCGVNGGNCSANGGECYGGPGMSHSNYIPKWHKWLYWDYWKMHGIPTPWHSRGNMTHHVPYIAVPKNYYYFRPYNWFHIPSQQIEASKYGADPRYPYDNRVVFDGLYEGLE